MIVSENVGALKHLNTLQEKAFFLRLDAFFFSLYLIRTSVSMAGYSRVVPLAVLSSLPPFTHPLPCFYTHYVTVKSLFRSTL